jgi:hypothetical protein
MRPNNENVMTDSFVGLVPIPDRPIICSHSKYWACEPAADEWPFASLQPEAIHWLFSSFSSAEPVPFFLIIPLFWPF